jgi:hypothetical protein
LCNAVLHSVCQFGPRRDHHQTTIQTTTVAPTTEEKTEVKKVSVYKLDPSAKTLSAQREKVEHSTVAKSKFTAVLRFEAGKPVLKDGKTQLQEDDIGILPCTK